MVRVLAGVKGIGVETADMLVHEIFSRPLRDRRAVARYAGLTGSPDERGGRRREKGLVHEDANPVLTAQLKRRNLSLIIDVHFGTPQAVTCGKSLDFGAVPSIAWFRQQAR